MPHSVLILRRPERSFPISIILMIIYSHTPCLAHEERCIKKCDLKVLHINSLLSWHNDQNTELILYILLYVQVPQFRPIDGLSFHANLSSSIHVPRTDIYIYIHITYYVRIIISFNLRLSFQKQYVVCICGPTTRCHHRSCTNK